MGNKINGLRTILTVAHAASGFGSFCGIVSGIFQPYSMLYQFIDNPKTSEGSPTTESLSELSTLSEAHSFRMAHTI